MSKFKVGDKVVPVSKSLCCILELSNAWLNAMAKNQPFLFVIKIEKGILCDENVNSICGDYFLESDLIPYKEVAARIEPKGKPPVYYTLPKPKEIPAIIGLWRTGAHEYDPLKFTPYESEYPTQPDYKGFYEFIMANACKECIECPCNGEFCEKLNKGCSATLAEYAENKFIKRG